jgi:hypothetical protein
MWSAAKGGVTPVSQRTGFVAMNRDFEIRQGIYLVQPPHELDLHNNFDFVGLEILHRASEASVALAAFER